MTSALEKPLQSKRRGLLPSGWKVPERFRERLGERAGRQRHMLEEAHLLIVAHCVPVPGEPERSPRFFWRAPLGDWQSSHLGEGPAALSRHLAEFEAAIESAEERLKTAQNARDLFAILHEVGPLHRTGRNLHATLQSAREAVGQDRDLLLARDRAADLERACELAREEAQHRLDLAVAENSEAHAVASAKLALQGQRLNLLAAIFLPITAVGSVFGMNLHSNLETTGGPWLFWSVSGCAVVLGLWVRAALKTR